MTNIKTKYRYQVEQLALVVKRPIGEIEEALVRIPRVEEYIAYKNTGSSYRRHFRADVFPLLKEILKKIEDEKIERARYTAAIEDVA